MFFVAVLSAQDAEVVERDGKTYWKHEVERKETLYGISRIYGVEIEDIIFANPEAQEGLKPKMTLFIPKKEDKPEIHQEQQQHFFIHKVKKGETLFGLSKLYRVEMNEIIEMNPETRDGLSLGQELKIPTLPKGHTEEERKKVEKPLPELEGKNWIIHEVEQGETLYSLSKKYDVEIEEIKKANDGLPDGLKVGMELIIPKEKEVDRQAEVMVEEIDSLFGQDYDHQVDKDTIVQSEMLKGDTVEIAFLLPFFTARYDSLHQIYKENNDKIFELNSATMAALEFYNGALLAVDTLLNKGISIRLKVFDTARDTLAISELIDSGELDSTDLIVGPFFREQVEQIAAFSARTHKPVVCPVPQTNKVLLKSPYLFKIPSSTITQMSEVTAYIAKRYHNENIIVINSKNIRDDVMFQTVKADINKHLQEYGDGEVKESYTEKFTIDHLKASLDTGRVNCIVVPSGNVAYVTDFFNKILDVDTAKYEIHLFGSESWAKMDNISFRHKQQYNLHLTSAHYLNHQTDAYRQFLDRYRKQTQNYPNEFAFLGFDAMFFFTDMIYGGHGKGSNRLKSKDDYFYTRFDFVKTGPESGYENKAYFLLRYQDFSILNLSYD